MDLNRKNLPNENLIIIEDVVDSGRTLSYLVGYLQHKGARSVKTCTLLDKPDRRVTDFVPDYTGVMIPDEFVVGYGLDYIGNYRNLPYLGVLDRKVYEN